MHELHEIDFNLATRENPNNPTLRQRNSWPGCVGRNMPTGKKTGMMVPVFQPMKSIEIPNFWGTNIHKAHDANDFWCSPRSVLLQTLGTRWTKGPLWGVAGSRGSAGTISLPSWHILCSPYGSTYIYIYYYILYTIYIIQYICIIQYTYISLYM